jgi:hypothetical protein
VKDTPSLRSRSRSSRSVRLQRRSAARRRRSRESFGATCRQQARYSPDKAHSYAVARRRRSRRNSHFSPDEWILVEHLVALDWSPEQVSDWLSLHRILSISHETIYLRVWHDKRCGGDLWTHTRQANKRCRKRYRSHDSRGRLPGERHIFERPATCRWASSPATVRTTRLLAPSRSSRGSPSASRDRGSGSATEHRRNAMHNRRRAQRKCCTSNLNSDRLLWIVNVEEALHINEKRHRCCIDPRRERCGFSKVKHVRYAVLDDRVNAYCGFNKTVL